MPGTLSPILEKNCSSKINPFRFYVSKKKKKRTKPQDLEAAIVNSNQLSQQVTSVDGAIQSSIFVQLFEWFFKFIIIFYWNGEK